MKKRYLSPLLGLLAVCATADVTDVPGLLRSMGIDTAELARLKAGRVHNTGLPSHGTRDIAAASFAWVPVAPALVMDRLEDGSFFARDRDLISAQGVSNRVAIAFGATETEELLALMRADKDAGFNLSAAEVTALTAAAKGHALREVETPGAARDDMNGAYSAVLTRRLQAYPASGPFSAYVREQGTRDPAAELKAAIGASVLLRDVFPGLKAAIVSYPNSNESMGQHQFHVLKVKAQGRPVAVLAHRSFYASAGASLVVEQQFYVGRSYNAMLILVACVPVEEGTLVVYVNRTSTDQVDGVGGRFARAIGRRMMREAQAEALAWLRDTLIR